jgi:hypothetical protein
LAKLTGVPLLYPHTRLKVAESRRAIVLRLSALYPAKMNHCTVTVTFVEVVIFALTESVPVMVKV